VRVEADSLGSVDVPSEVYWGVSTARALDNFAISGRRISEYPDPIRGFACVEQAAARANPEVGSPAPGPSAILRARRLVRNGTAASRTCELDRTPKV
jgi:aspartate ammonia-lyase